MSLIREENRLRFIANERAYLDEWQMTEAQKQAVLARDWNAAIAEGGHIYYLSKIIATSGVTFLQAASTMAGLSVEEYSAMMVAGGRSPDGQRSIRERR